MINSRVRRTGDGSHRDAERLGKPLKEEEEVMTTTYWGFGKLEKFSEILKPSNLPFSGDIEMTEADKKKVKIISR